MKTVLAVAAVIALGAIATGCKRGPDLAGKWTGTMNGMTATFEFAPDDKVTVSTTTPGGQINLLGDYKVSGEELTLNLTDVQAPGLDDKRAGMVKQSLASVLNKPTTMKMTFVSPDELSLTEKKAPGTKPPSSEKKAPGTNAAAAPAAMTLKRVKEGS